MDTNSVKGVTRPAPQGRRDTDLRSNECLETASKKQEHRGGRGQDTGLFGVVVGELQESFADE